MKIVEKGNSFELHIISAVTNYYVTSNNKTYNYYRLIIPNVLVNFFLENNPNTKYVYLYFIGSDVFLSAERLDDVKYSRRKLMKFKDRNIYFIYLNIKSLTKHNVTVNDSVKFIISNGSVLKSQSNVQIRIKF